MSALGEVQARIASIRKLKAVVSAMRGIAATHVQQARASLQGYRAYTDVIAGGLGRAVQLLEPDPAAHPASVTGPTAVVMFAAEHGFAGAFSEHVLDAPAPAAETVKPFVVGARGLILATQRGWTVDWTAPMASQVSGVAATARRVADTLYSGFTEGRFARAEIVFAQTMAGADVAVVRRPILPLDLEAFRAPRAGPPPLTNLPPPRLVEQLVGEYVFAELALAALESFASENAARLATMESARMNIDKKLDDLSGQERLLRQEEITAEVQDIVSGALASEGSQGAHAAQGL